MYTIGSIADIISGKNTPNKKMIQVKEISYRKPVIQKNVVFEKTFKNGKQIFKKPQLKPKQSVNNISTNRKYSNSEKRLPLKRKSNSNAPKINSKKPKLDHNDNNRTIFVGNVPLDTTEKELKKHFSSYGEIDSIRFRGIPIADSKTPKKVAFLQKKFHPNRKTMISYIVFKSKTDAIKAKTANGTEFKNFHLRVNHLEDQQTYDKKKAIMIGNLPFNAEEEDIRKLFQDCGAINNIRLVRDPKTNMGKGFGYVNFENADAVELALQLENIKLGNRDIRVSGYKDFNNKQKTPEGKKVRERFAIHINNLPKETTETDLRNLFQKCGKILSVRIPAGSKNKFCYINFKDAKGVENASKLDTPILHNTQIKVNICKSKEIKQADIKQTEIKQVYPSIYIKNIPFHTTQLQIRQLFQCCGHIRYVKIQKHIMRQTCIAFVTFETETSVTQALQKTFKIGENQLKVTKKIKKSENDDKVGAKEQEIVESDSDEDVNDDENDNSESAEDSDEPSEEEDNSEDLDEEDVDDEEDEDYEDAEENDEVDEEEEDSNDEVDNESDDE